MSWLVPVDFSTGRLVSATDWNAELGTAGNMSMTAVALASAAGQIPYATGTNALAMLAVGPNRAILGSTGSAPAWSNTPTIGTTDAVTAAVTNILTLAHSSSGTPAANYGVGMKFIGQSSTTADRDMAAIQAYWTTATDASRSAAIAFQVVQGAGALAAKLLLQPTTGGASTSDYDLLLNAGGIDLDSGFGFGPSVNFHSNSGSGGHLFLNLVLKGTAGATNSALGVIKFHGLNGGTTSVGASTLSASLDGATNSTKLQLQNLNAGIVGGTLEIDRQGQMRLSGASVFTANAKMTTGLTINQGGADDEILALKSSDVAHGMTTRLETDTYASFFKLSPTSGGLRIYGASSGNQAFEYDGLVTTGDTTKSTAAVAAFYLTAGKKSGTTTGAMGSTDNLALIGDLANGARFIFQADGTSYEDVGTAWTNYDDHDDVALLDSLSVHASRPDDPIHEQFRGWVDSVGRERLQALDLIHFNDDGHHFINRSKTQMLLIGATRQIGGRVAQLEARLTDALARLSEAEHKLALTGA